MSKLFGTSERRRARRQISPPLLAFYWNGGLPEPHVVPDISRTGMFVKTNDRWSESSLLRVTLQMQSEDPQKSGETITVQCKVVRAEEDGVGMALMLAEDKKSKEEAAAGSMATRKQLKTFLEHLSAAAEELPQSQTPDLPFLEPAQTKEEPTPQTTQQQPKADQ
ncbi:MAG: PilZ domain-containing protein [Acidobacteriaceae bacterium]